MDNQGRASASDITKNRPVLHFDQVDCYAVWDELDYGVQVADNYRTRGVNGTGSTDTSMPGSVARTVLSAKSKRALVRSS